MTTTSWSAAMACEATACGEVGGVGDGEDWEAPTEGAGDGEEWEAVAEGAGDGEDWEAAAEGAGDGEDGYAAAEGAREDCEKSGCFVTLTEIRGGVGST